MDLTPVDIVGKRCYHFIHAEDVEGIRHSHLDCKYLSCGRGHKPAGFVSLGPVWFQCGFLPSRRLCTSERTVNMRGEKVRHKSLQLVLELD